VRPLLFEVWGFAVPAYGLTMVVLFVAGLLLLRRRAPDLGMSDHQLFDLAAVAGAAFLLWVLVGLLLAGLKIAGPPHLNALPVLAIGAFGFLAYMRKAGLPAERIFDAIAPVAALALAAQYGIGTLLAGTAFGKPTDLPWGVSFPPGSPAYKAYGSQPLQPVQLYLGISFLIVAIAVDFAPVKLRDGQRALMCFMAISIVYLVTSPLRGNTTSLFLGDAPRMSELAALSILLFCSVMAWRRHVVANQA
jgi:phosphatidylglycerol:prolipoprotein diacylglycerol transferase